MDRKHPDVETATFMKRSCSRGYHIYKDLREVVVGKELVCQRQRGNGACMSVRARQWSLYVSESEAMELVCQ